MSLSPTIITLIRNAWDVGYPCLLAIVAFALLATPAPALNSFRAQHGRPRLRRAAMVYRSLPP